jgi:hypothetical protein
VDVGHGDPGRNGPEVGKGGGEPVEARVRDRRLPPDDRLAVEIPTFRPGHDLEEGALSALGKSDNADFHRETPVFPTL